MAKEWNSKDEEKDTTTAVSGKWTFLMDDGKSGLDDAQIGRMPKLLSK